MSDLIDPEGEPDGLARIVLSGRDPAQFDVLFDKLEGALVGALDGLTTGGVDADTEAIVGEVRRAGQEFLEAKLRKGSIENDLKLAEITRTYAEAEEALARREKVVQETEAQRIENARLRLRACVEVLTFKAAIRRDADGNLTLDLAALGSLARALESPGS